MPSTRGNALVGQSGGPTVVINQSLVGVVEACLGSDAVQNVYGALHGVQGILAEDLVDLGRETRENLELVAGTPCAGLRSVRKKPTREECERVLEVFQAHDVRYFFYIGGNDSAETAHILNEIAQAQSYDVRLFHVPKTIDNDLRVTDHCPGYGSAARFVACAFMGDNQDNRSLPGIKIDVVMGRHAGWLTAASILGRRFEDDGPHLVYLPERPLELDQFAADVERVHGRLGRCLVAVSEGVHGADGEPLGKTDERDSHGNVQLSGSGALGDFLAAQVKARLGSKLRVRADTFGYLQRSFAGFASGVDQREAREVGRTAVRVATAGDRPHGSVVIRREPGPEYRVSYQVADLKDVAKLTRTLDDRYIRAQGELDPSFLDYALPLVGELPAVGRLGDHRVARKLAR